MTTTQLAPKRAKVNLGHILVVATNADYAKLCARSLLRLPSRKKVKVLSFSSLEDVTLPTPRPQSTLVVSRLSDISQPGLQSNSVGPTTRQLVFLEGLPVEAVVARLLPLNIRNSQRLHIVAGHDQAAIAALIYRLVSGMAELGGSDTIVDAWLENEQLVLLSPAFTRLRVPLVKFARFIGAEQSQVARFEIDEDGRFLHWPHADVHLGWMQFRQLVDPAAAITDIKKTAQFNKRYGAAIRALRDLHSLKQSEIDGITERQLRRVEQGEQAVSKKTLAALAKAHSLSLDDYLDKIAKGVTTDR